MKSTPVKSSKSEKPKRPSQENHSTNGLATIPCLSEEFTPMPKFKGTKAFQMDLNKEDTVKGIKTKKQDRKQDRVVDFTKESNTKGQELRFDPNNLMSKLEEFSDVWNDCPVDTQRWSGSHDHRTTSINRAEKYQKEKTTENVNNKNSLQSTEDKSKKSDKVKRTNFSDPFKDVKSTFKQPRQVQPTLEEKEKPSDINHVPEHDQNQQTKYDSKLADLKRKKAVQEQRQLQVEKKNIIKQALSALDGKQLNKKTVFSDGEEDQEKQSTIGEGSKSNERKQLFNDDDSEPEADLKLNRQFEGKKGQKLLQLQSKFASDSRFSLDTRFYESSSEDGEHEVPEITNSNEEKKRQLAILETIVKQPIKPLSEIKNKSRKSVEDTVLLRFDPSREDHSKYIVKPQETPGQEDESVPKKKRKKNKNEESKDVKTSHENKTEVSSEKFFTVKEDLKEVLRKESKPEFSLLKLFNSSNTKLPEEEPEKSQTVRKLKHGTKNPFKYDSSESEPEEETQKKKERKRKRKPIWRTPFFFTANDSRFKEALEFLKCPEETEGNKEFAEKRKLLKNFIQKKFKNNNRKKGPFKKKLGGFKRNFYQKKKKGKAN